MNIGLPPEFFESIGDWFRDLWCWMFGHKWPPHSELPIRICMRCCECLAMPETAEDYIFNEGENMQSFKIFQVQGADKKPYVIEAKNFDDARAIILQHVPDFDLEHCTWSRLPTAGGVKTLTRLPASIALAQHIEQSVAEDEQTEPPAETPTSPEPDSDRTEKPTSRARSRR